ncbi:hypothetical protein FHX37_1831 [Haloactinospora alba]|uniref:PH (Pleckstrin Homology) domain-containing protein n=1 Tax=Haloactinospora alba TaxID=405555 RepID=A0A543NJA9_9ACTN|nr:STM3941 family protein [Haloactinospora alba]TQN31908.1 hypothetical protein FHX37_1831 [Haloactinospora alba]
MRNTAEPFTVANRVRVTWEGTWLAAACTIFAGAGAALALRDGSTDTAIGVVALVLFGGGGLLAASRMLSRRPVLVLDEAGVRLVAPWPRPSSGDVFLRWEDIAAVRVCSQLVPYRGAPTALRYLDFVPRGEADQPPQTPGPWQPHHAVRIRESWDHTVADVIAEVRRHRPDMPFEEQRAPWSEP